MRWFSLLVIATLAMTSPAWTAESSGFPDFRHIALTVEQGAPAAVYDIAQTKDGYMWFATATGLWRYDGVEYEQVKLPDTLPRRSIQLRVVFADGEGSLWIGHDWGGLTRYRSGIFTDMNISAPFGQPIQMFQDAKKRVWVLSVGVKGTNLWRFSQGQGEQLIGRLGLQGESGRDLMLGRDGTVWVTLASGVAYLRPDAHRFTILPVKMGEWFPTLVEASDGSIWLGQKSEMQQVWDGVRDHSPHLSTLLVRFPKSIEPYRYTRDYTGATWIGASGSGLHRLNLSKERPSESRIDSISTGALSSPIINALFTDHENNVWVGTNLGLDKFRPVSISKVLDYREDTENYGVTGAIVMSGAGSTVLVKSGGPFHRVQGDGSLQLVPSSGAIANGACIDSAGSIWIRKNGSLVRAVDRRRIAVPREQGNIFSTGCDLTEKSWWLAGGGGLYRREADGTWKRFALDPAMYGLGGPAMIAHDPNGSLIAAFPNWKTYRVLGDRQELLWPQANPLGFINFMSNVGGDVFIGGTRGLARHGHGGLQLLNRNRYPLLHDVTGIAMNEAGQTWLAVHTGLVSVSTTDLLAAFQNPAHQLQFRAYGPKDGLDTPSRSDMMNSLALDRARRLWIATPQGIFMLDPARLSPNRFPPPVIIKSLRTNDRVWSVKEGLTLPEGTSQLQIDFAAMSFRNPQAVRYRYRLSGHDDVWTDAGARRQAIYTDLPPGSYVFQVIAANEDGVWNDKGASTSFVIPPTFFQSDLFRGLCCAVFILLLAAAYRVRIRQSAARIETRLTERVAERERIARELHDTLLQGVQGLILGMQNLADDLPRDAPARINMTMALDKADELLAESRDRVHDLRKTTQARGFPETLILLAERTLAGALVEVRSAVVGEERNLHPVVADELVRLSEEALFNIYKHAHASRVTVAVTFGMTDFMLRIEDDGVGLACDQPGRRGAHRQFGMIGMRERVFRIGGEFKVDGRPGAGTSVQVTVPASAAYAEEPRIGRTRRRLARWFPA